MRDLKICSSVNPLTLVGTHVELCVLSAIREILWTA
jgi:hypothetical protein